MSDDGPAPALTPSLPLPLPDPGRAWLIARTDLRRRVRDVSDRATALIGFILAGGMGLVLLFALPAGAFAAGRAVASGASVPVGAVASAAGFVAFLPAFVTFFRLLQGRGSLDHPAAELTAVPHRDVVAGLYLSEGLPAFASGAVALVLVAGGFAVGSGAALAAVGPLLAGGVAVLLGFSAGFAAGLGVAALVRRVPVLARNRAALGLVAVVAYVAAVVGGPEDPFVNVAAVVGRSPVGWLAHLALVGTPAGDPALAAAALLLGCLAAAGCAALAVPFAGAFWSADPVGARSRGESGRGSRADDGATARLLAALARVVGRPARHVAATAWRRAARAPVELSYVVYPLLFLVGPLTTAARTGTAPPFLPPLVALYVAWAVGAAFTLNPLGGEGPVLPATLTSGVGGRAFVRGRRVAGVVAGAPLAAGLTAAVGVVSPLGPVGTVVVAAGAAVATVPATGVAAGAGAASPRFEAVRVTRSRRAVVPSLGAFAAYSLVLVGCATPAVLAAVPGVASWLGGAAGVATTTATAAAAATTLALGGLAGAVGTRYAASRVESYRL
jgi:hypothetical protein